MDCRLQKCQYARDIYNELGIDCRPAKEQLESARAARASKFWMKFSKIRIWANQANGLDEDECVTGLEYLVLGHFKRNERDVKGVDKMAWLSMAELIDSDAL